MGSFARLLRSGPSLLSNKRGVLSDCQWFETPVEAAFEWLGLLAEECSASDVATIVRVAGRWLSDLIAMSEVS